ncbi:MAG: hypothetical protein AB7F75_02235 [Planctomycetota bacterium]
MNQESLSLFLTYFVAFMACALDLAGFGIPLWLTLPAIAAGLGSVIALGGLNPTSLLGLLMDPNSPPSITHVMANALLVLMFFGWATRRGAMAKGDLCLVLSLACLNRFFPFVSLLMHIAICGFALAIIHVLRSGLGLQACRAVGRALMLRSRERCEDGSLVPVHKLTMPYSPAVLLGVLTSGGGRGW